MSIIWTVIRFAGVWKTAMRPNLVRQTSIFTTNAPTIIRITASVCATANSAIRPQTAPDNIMWLGVPAPTTVLRPRNTRNVYARPKAARPGVRAQLPVPTAAAEHAPAAPPALRLLLRPQHRPPVAAEGAEDPLLHLLPVADQLVAEAAVAVRPEITAQAPVTQHCRAALPDAATAEVFRENTGLLPKHPLLKNAGAEAQPNHYLRNPVMPAVRFIMMGI